MPVPGLGASPPAGGLYNELTYTTRRAFVPLVFVQMYFASPSLYFLMGNAQRSAGGMNQITIPVQGQSMVQGQFIGYSGGFNSPTIIPGIQNLQFNTAYWAVPVPLPFGESVIQSTEREISILRARMNDAYAVTRQNVAKTLFTSNTGDVHLPNSFLDAFDDGTNYPTYGGINRNAAGNASLKGQFYTATTSGYSVATFGHTRKSMSALLTQVADTAGGEFPTCVVMNPSDHATLNADIIGTETQFVTVGKEYNADTSVRSSFPNLSIAGVPIFADHFCPRGTVVGFNTKYTSMYLSEDAAFDFSGFHSLVPLGQIGQQGVVLLGYNLVTAKPSSGFIQTGVGNPAF